MILISNEELDQTSFERSSDRHRHDAKWFLVKIYSKIFFFQLSMKCLRYYSQGKFGKYDETKMETKLRFKLYRDLNISCVHDSNYNLRRKNNFCKNKSQFKGY